MSASLLMQQCDGSTLTLLEGGLGQRMQQRFMNKVDCTPIEQRDLDLNQLTTISIKIGLCTEDRDPTAKDAAMMRILEHNFMCLEASIRAPVIVCVHHEEVTRELTHTVWAMMNVPNPQATGSRHVVCICKRYAGPYTCCVHSMLVVFEDNF